MCLHVFNGILSCKIYLKIPKRGLVTCLLIACFLHRFILASWSNDHRGRSLMFKIQEPNLRCTFYQSQVTALIFCELFFYKFCMISYGFNCGESYVTVMRDGRLNLKLKNQHFLRKSFHANESTYMAIHLNNSSHNVNSY